MLECSDNCSSFKKELSIMLVWPMTYTTCVELLGPYGLLPYEVGIFPTLHWIPWKWVLRWTYQWYWQRLKLIYYNMAYKVWNGVNDVNKWTDQVTILLKRDNSYILWLILQR